MTEYKRDKPQLYTPHPSGCDSEHPREFYMYVEHHLAEALRLLSDRSKVTNYKNDESWYLEHSKEIEHHILSAWEKSK